MSRSSGVPNDDEYQLLFEMARKLGMRVIPDSGDVRQLIDQRDELIEKFGHACSLALRAIDHPREWATPLRAETVKREALEAINDALLHKKHRVPAGSFVRTVINGKFKLGDRVYLRHAWRFQDAGDYVSFSANALLEIVDKRWEEWAAGPFYKVVDGHGGCLGGLRDEDLKKLRRSRVRRPSPAQSKMRRAAL